MFPTLAPEPPEDTQHQIKAPSSPILTVFVQQQCPQRQEITPCTCQVKKNGLDVLCESTNQTGINEAMRGLKGKSLVIFYLKLRHNNLKKLTAFVFLGLDIRHLTIHNSSLAVVEEASLSSIASYVHTMESHHGPCATDNLSLLKGERMDAKNGQFAIVMSFRGQVVEILHNIPEEQQNDYNRIA
ncbi:hypothetical protein NQ318_000309 [Aromia moschata]|uniref:Uncharacterized protein n=1 Tax=Aromia moschata TaxID=1265417 RepID=A0AAV8YUR9_9CUCU|nr:hypothetical protein NQ318_000309 [Aromia moschata]